MTYAEVRGRAPSYGPKELDRFPNDHAMCAGVWVPGADRWMVPQGMAVADDGTAYLAGFDGTKPARQRFCSLERIDLRTGRLVTRVDPVRGSIGGAPRSSAGTAGAWCSTSTACGWPRPGGCG